MRVYLDWNATTPPRPDVVSAMQAAALEAWGNPASIHAHGRAARAFVEDAREAVAALGGVDARDVLLTSGGTEANNIALRSAFATVRTERPPKLVTSRLEHPSVTRVAEALEDEGLANVHWLTVTPDGRPDLGDLAQALSGGDVRLVTVQAVNHETGVVEPVAEVVALAKARGAHVHVDAVQGWGKVDVTWEGADTVSLAAHKMRGPKGIGALLARPGVRLRPLLRGGAQERGLRPGTVDPVACAGLAVAARAASGHSLDAMGALRDELEARIVALAPGSMVNGAGERAPHVTNVAVSEWGGAELVAALDLEGVSISSGSACSAGTSEPSPVLRAMLGEGRASASVRISLGETTTRAEVELALGAFARVLSRRGARNAR